MAIHIILMDLFAYLNMLYFGVGWITFAVAAILASTAQVRVFFSLKNSVFALRKINKLLNSLSKPIDQSEETK